MPLSEREQQILQEIEKNLYDEDPDFARKSRLRTPGWSDGSFAKLGVAGIVVGFGALIAFFMSGSLLVGVLAFGIMVGGIVLLATSFRSALVAGRQGRRERVARALTDLEQRLRQRYKKN